MPEGVYLLLQFLEFLLYFDHVVLAVPAFVIITDDFGFIEVA